MISKPIYGAAISDVHLGHRNTQTVKTIQGLKDAFPMSPETAKLDVIFIVGDLFDRLLSLNHPDVPLIHMWIYRFLRTCKELNIVIVLLKGTPSHDWNQNEMFLWVNTVSNLGCELYYIDDLDIIEIKSLGITILGVPDEYRPDNDETWKLVTELMLKRGYSKVDFALMHGLFNFQLPPHVKGNVHIPERYLGIVDHYIFNGHDHLGRTWDRITIQGSFDRLVHGDEGPKGHWRFIATPNNKDNEMVFVENKHATIYRTIDCRELSIEEAQALILEEMSLLPVGSYIRLWCCQKDPILSYLNDLRKQYMDFFWSTPKIEGEVSVSKINDYVSITYETVDITPNNLPDLVGKTLEDKGDISLDELKACTSLLVTIMSNVNP